jgi:hypothetical protein
MAWEYMIHENGIKFKIKKEMMDFTLMLLAMSRRCCVGMNGRECGDFTGYIESVIGR